MNILSITPQDLLFFRDSRPMGPSAGVGRGANWPQPSLLFDALHHALHRAFPDAAPSHTWRSHGGGGARPAHGQRFGSLSLCGPFPSLVDPADRQPRWYFPAPLDAGCSDARDSSRLARAHLITEGAGSGNLPAPFLYTPAFSERLDARDSVGKWWSKAAIEEWLEGETSIPRALRKNDTDFFYPENRVGIGIDPATGAQDGTNIFEQEYLRLLPEASLGIAAAIRDSEGPSIEDLFPDDNSILLAGGQRRVCRVEHRRQLRLADMLPFGKETISGTRLKMLLLTPALFPASEGHPGGLLPSWVDPSTGAVRRPAARPERPQGASRSKWRRLFADAAPPDVRLVSAICPGPVVLSGWSSRLHHPASDGAEPAGGGEEPLLYVVPAGTVYYFEGNDAGRLAQALNWHGSDRSSNATLVNRISSARGEQGYGLAVCGEWEPLE